MSRSYPAVDDDRTLRDEGDAADYMAHTAIENGGQIDLLVDQKAPNGVFMTREMADHVEQYVADCSGGMTQIDTSYGTDTYRVNGRADVIGWDDVSLLLRVADLKYGHRLVEPEENWTLVSHAIGFCLARSIVPARIVLYIYQPRPYHPDGPVREWQLTYGQLMQLYRQIVQTMTAPNDILNTGPSCSTCYAFATCPAARAADMNCIDMSSAAFDDDMPNDALSVMIDTNRKALAQLKHHNQALEELAKHRIRESGIVPNYFLESSYGHRRFRSGVTPALLGALSGLDASIPTLPTPAEMKRRGMTDEALAPFVERPTTGVKLVRRDPDKQARKAFK